MGKFALQGLTNANYMLVWLWQQVIEKKSGVWISFNSITNYKSMCASAALCVLFCGLILLGIKIGVNS